MMEPRAYSFHMQLRRASRRGADKIATETAFKDLKNIKLPTAELDNIFKNIEVRWDPNVKELKTTTGVPMSQVNKLVRRGDLKELVNTLKLNIQVTPSLEAAFKDLNKKCPEMHLKSSELAYAKAKQKYPTLDVKYSPDIKSKLSKSDVKKLNKVGTKLKTILGVGGVAVGVYFVVRLGVDFVESLNSAAKDASGCYATWVNNNGKVLAKKLYARSRYNKNGIADTYYFNYMGYLQWAVIKNEKNNSINLKEAFNVDYDVYSVEDVKKALLNNRENIKQYWFKNIHDLSDQMRPDPNLFSEVLVPGLTSCRACDENASADTILWVGLENLDNLTLECKDPPSLLEVLVDVTKNMGLDVMKMLGGSIFSSPIFIAVCIFIFIILFIIVIKRK